MTELLLHPTSLHQLKALTQSPPHAVLIAGGSGSGKKTIAKQYISEVLGAEQSSKTQNILTISSENKSIGITEIRNINEFIKRKTLGSASIRRVVCINDAQYMSTEAQNALLKVLEEPPEDTILVLTVDDITALKHTIRSRAQLLNVLPVSLDSAIAYFSKQTFSAQEITSAYYMSEGRVGLLCALLQNSTKHELVSAINSAKILLKGDAYSRVIEIDQFTKDKGNLLTLLDGLERVVMSALRQASAKDNAVLVRKFYTISKNILDSKKSLSQNVAPKIVLTDLFINM